MGRKIRLGCIGVGPRGQWLLQAAASHPAVQVAAVCDPNEENLNACLKKLRDDLHIEGVKGYASRDEFLACGIDAVIVATHIAAHTESAVAALDAGKHVLSEIPTIGSVEDARALLRATAAHPSLRYMAGENCCYWAFIRKWKEFYETGRVGDALLAESDYLHPFPTMERADGKQTWRSFMPSIHYITHNLGPLLFIMNDTVEEVYGFVPGANPLADRHPVPPDGVAMIRTRKGALIKIYIGFGMNHAGGHNFVLYGSRGSLENDRAMPMDQRITRAYFADSGHPYDRVDVDVGLSLPGQSDAGHGGADTRMTHEFIQALLEDRPPELGVEFGINVSLPGLLADQSSRENGRPIRMPTIDELR